MNISREAMSRGGKMRASRARTRLMLTIQHLTPIQAFRVGYVRGLQSKWRKTTRRQRAA